MTVTSGAATLGIQTVVVHILPSDLTYPVYDIIQVRGTDNQGVLDSIDTACELRGIVHGWNDYPQGLRFTLIDATRLLSSCIANLTSNHVNHGLHGLQKFGSEPKKKMRLPKWREV